MEFYESLLWYARLLTLYLEPESFQKLVDCGTSESVLLKYQRDGVIEHLSAAIDISQALLVLQACERSFELRHVCLRELHRRYSSHFSEQKPKHLQAWHKVLKDIAFSGNLLTLPAKRDSLHDMLVLGFVEMYPANSLHVFDVPQEALSIEVLSLSGADWTDSFLKANKIVFVGDCFVADIQGNDVCKKSLEVLELLLNEHLGLSLEAHFSEELKESFLKARPNTRT